MNLMVCEADGMSFSVGVLAVGDPARSGAVLRALQTSVREKLAVSSEVQLSSAGVNWASPSAQWGRWMFKGQGAGGPLQVEVLQGAHGPWVIQAMVLGPPRTSDVSEPFFDGLRRVH